MDRQHLTMQGRLAAFLRKVEDRFPGAPEKSEAIRTHVLNPISQGTDPDDCLAFVRDSLRKAKELVADFEDIVNEYGRSATQGRLQMMSDQNNQRDFRPSSRPSFTLSSIPSTPQPPNRAGAADSPTADLNAPHHVLFPESSLLPRRPKIATAPPQLSLNKVATLSITQDCQDDGHPDDIRNLLVLSEVNIPPDQRKQTPRQMACALTEHQKIGLTWLLEREKDRMKKGGLLADTMGLGKTVQAMALILAHPSHDPKNKTTLIVAPLALLRQWEQEILTKVKPQHKLNTFVFHGSDVNDTPVSELLRQDVVLCTYGKLVTEYKNKFENKKPEKLRILADKARFFRVILDEAHNIRNGTTYCSKAAAELQSNYRLCMTGTPFMNRAEEIYPLIRFLRIPPYNEWERFSEDIVRPLRKWDGDMEEHGMRKLQALFRSFTLRRTKDSRLDGKPIIELPPRTDVPAFVEFNDEQREFYKALEVQQQLKFNKYLINGAVMKNYIHILILLLRLRQACDHPFLLKNLGIPDGAKLDGEQMVKLACDLPPAVLRKLKRQKRFECLICNDATDNPVIMHPCGHYICHSCFTGSVKALEIEQLNDIRSDGDGSPKKKSGAPCPAENCDNVINPKKIVCYMFLFDIPDQSPPPEKGNNEDPFISTKRADDAIRSIIIDDVDSHGNLRDFVVPDNKDDVDEDTLEAIPYYEEISDDEDSDDSQDEEANDKAQEAADGKGRMASHGDIGPSQTDGAFDDMNKDSKFQTPKRKPKRKSSASELEGHSGKKSRTASQSAKKKGKAVKKKNKKFVSMADQRQLAQRSAIAMSRYKERLRRDWISSAKIDAIMRLLEQIRPKGEKTLVFSLWTSFLDLVEIPVERAGIKYTRYDGSMTPGAREAAVKSFMKNPGVRVMLVSLTAGNAGLNLTAASQVIVTEPFWNPYVEEQAIDRAHRFGQTKPVTVHRLLIAGTVEDRILQLQEKKKMLVDAALSEKGAAKVSKLNEADLANLFGL